MAVLIVGCPCALILAAPTAMADVVHNIGSVIVVFASASLAIFPDGSTEARSTRKAGIVCDRLGCARMPGNTSVRRKN